MASPPLKMVLTAAAVVFILCNIGLTPARARSAAYKQATPLDKEQSLKGEYSRTVSLATTNTSRLLLLYKSLPNVRLTNLTLVDWPFIADSAVCKKQQCRVQKRWRRSNSHARATLHTCVGAPHSPRTSIYVGQNRSWEFDFQEEVMSWKLVSVHHR